MTDENVSPELRRGIRAFRRATGPTVALEARASAALRGGQRPRRRRPAATSRRAVWAVAMAATALAGASAVVATWPTPVDEVVATTELEVILARNTGEDWLHLPTRVYEHHDVAVPVAFELETPRGVSLEPHAVRQAWQTDCDAARCVHRWEDPPHEIGLPLRVSVPEAGDYEVVLRSRSEGRLVHERFVMRAR